MISCASTNKTGAPVASLCILDFEAQTCWKDRVHNVGIRFEEMKSCDKGGTCWFAIDEYDLNRVFKTLNSDTRGN